MTRPGRSDLSVAHNHDPEGATPSAATNRGGAQVQKILWGALGVCIARSPADANFLLVEGKPNQGEFADLAKVKHCVGHVTFSRGEESRILERLADVLAGALLPT